jgi:hypothetical protein
MSVAQDPGSGRGPDPTEPWRQLYRATVGAVSEALTNNDVARREEHAGSKAGDRKGASR